jgi:hypothetical protein
LREHFNCEVSPFFEEQYNFREEILSYQLLIKADLKLLHSMLGLSIQFSNTDIICAICNYTLKERTNFEHIINNKNNEKNYLKIYSKIDNLIESDIDNDMKLIMWNLMITFPQYIK